MKGGATSARRRLDGTTRAATGLAALALLLALGACNQGGTLDAPQDLAIPDLSPNAVPDATVPADLVVVNPCGDTDPSCQGQNVVAPFPLHTDPMVDPAERDINLVRDGNGNLVIDVTPAPTYDRLFIANEVDLGKDGTVSVFDRKTVREVARYRTVTCYSKPGGSTAACDGDKGCCARDDWPRYRARKDVVPPPGRQQVQAGSNRPSRTATAWNGDVFVANRALGGQSSVTKIAGERARCVDRDGSGAIDTSSDVNGDGVIETDCNGNGVPDNRADVKQLPCTKGLGPEFLGEDDECLLWTSNTFAPGAVGNALALRPTRLGPTEVWAGSGDRGTFARLDGDSGLVTVDVELPAQCRIGGQGPVGAAIDASGLLWAPPFGSGSLCWLDTRHLGYAGWARDPDWGLAQGSTIAIDRDQSIWLGSAVLRYVPDRSRGFASVGAGWWTQVKATYGAGIAADSRSAKGFFVYSCSDGLAVKQIPASTIPIAQMDQQITDPGWPVIKMPCFGVAVDAAQDVWGIDKELITRAHVDAAGAITQPVVNGPPAGKDLCPRGDSCPLEGAIAYGEFSGFGPQNLGGAATGEYDYVLSGRCLGMPGQRHTLWRRVVWEADLPPGTTLLVQLRFGDTPMPDDSWKPLTPAYSESPIDLGEGVRADRLEVLAQISTPDPALVPRLKRVVAYSECQP